MDVFDGMQLQPYWWDEAPRNTESPPALPDEIDVLVIGAGYTGLCAARVLAKAGRSVLVCESGFVGFGASTRNGGMLGPSFHKLGVAGLKAHYGEERTNGILSESIGFVSFVSDLIEEEQIACDFGRSGRFRGACRPSHYETMARELETQVEATGIEADLVPASGVREEIGSAKFCGGVRYAIDGGLHPGKYHDGLVRVVRGTGGVIAPQTTVTQIEKTTSGHRVVTSRGVVEATTVVVCTNGYTENVTPWFRRRVLPIRSSMIATEELTATLMQQLMPAGRMYGDSRRVMAYYRPSPDGNRVLFGGRATSGDKPLVNARKLRLSMIDVFPELQNVRISHSWSGLVAYAFDHVPHLGCHDDLWYAMGYCGSGVSRASFFGTKLGYKILGDAEQGRTAFDDMPMTTRPLYTGNPWFMSPIIQWHRMLDRFGV